MIIYNIYNIYYMNHINKTLMLSRTDSEILTTYKNKCCVIMAPLKMREKIKVIEDDLKKKLKQYK